MPTSRLHGIILTEKMERLFRLGTMSRFTRGRPVFFDDAERLLKFVTKLTANFEDRSSTGWKVTDSPKDYIASELKEIVGFEMPIESLEGKWKLGQNRPEADRKGAIEGLRHRAAGRDLELSDEMDAQLKGK
jgi:transcriptional regulator